MILAGLWRRTTEPQEPLDRLARDLTQITLDERCSFGAELRAELAQEHLRVQLAKDVPRSSARRCGWVCVASALVLAAIIVSGTVAAMGRIWGPAPPSPPTAGNEPWLETEPRAVVRDLVEKTEQGAAPQGEMTVRPVMSATLPTLLDRDAARRLVAREYPSYLQEAGIGGTVVVLTWVSPDGVPDQPQIERSSGVQQLDSAALRAMHALHFTPATRGGDPVGTWVEFSVRFEPGAGEPQPSPQYQAFQIPLSN